MSAYVAPAPVGQTLVAQAPVGVQIAAPAIRKPEIKWAIYDKVHYQIMMDKFPGGDLAETFNIQTALIKDWKPEALLDKIIEGPPAIMGMWTVISIVMGFFPKRYKSEKEARAAIKTLAGRHFPSLKKVEIKNDQVILVNFCTLYFSGTNISIVMSFCTVAYFPSNSTNFYSTTFLILIYWY